jgi:ribosomal protein S12 methylthiotransferase accessory factor
VQERIMAKVGNQAAVSSLLESVRKGYTLDQDKAVAPDETIARATARIRSMPELADFTMKQRATAVPGAFTYSSATPALATCGKGLTAEQSMASAVMEFAERFSWLHYDYERAPGYCFVPYRQLAGGPTALPGPDYFFNNFVDLPEREQRQSEVEALPLRWVRGVRLGDGAPFLYPLNWHNLLFSSNGLAAGNVREEAIVQAACELIERENIYRVFVEGQRGRRLDLNSVDNPLVRTVVAQATQAGINLDVLECGLELGVPTFIVRGTKESDHALLTHCGYGNGCHLSPVKALIRALAEYFEGFGTMAAMQSEVSLPWELVKKMWPSRHMGFINLCHPENFERVTGTVTLSEVADVSLPDLRDEVELLVGRLAASGADLILIDKQHAELQIPTVRLFSPQLRSVLNTEIRRPYELLAAACFEGGQRELAAKHYENAQVMPGVTENMDSLPFANMILSAFMRAVPLEKVFHSDYRAFLANATALKKSGMVYIKDMMHGSGAGVLG